MNLINWIFPSWKNENIETEAMDILENSKDISTSAVMLKAKGKDRKELQKTVDARLEEIKTENGGKDRKEQQKIVDKRIKIIKNM